MSLYFAGKDAYNSGNYEAAQKHFQEALVKDENIEAKAQNIKYMLGVSAFNNQDYKTAITYLSLFSDNPIAQDLLSKIEVYETTLPEDFLYHSDNSEQQVVPVATSASQAQDNNQEEGTKQKTVIIIIVTTLTIMAFSVFFEIKKSVFSRMALKLVGVSSNTMLVKSKTPTELKTTEQLSDIEDEGLNNIPETNTASLIETPFDEEIDIEEMASKDIEEISRFFDELPENIDNDQNVNRQETTNDEENNEETESARDSILNSLLDEEDATESELQETNEVVNNTQTQSEPLEIDQPENIQPAEVSKKPKYEHLDNIPDDFNVNLAIENAFKLIEKSTKTNSNNTDGQQDEGFKSVEEMEKEMEEKEKINLNYFQEMEDIDDDSLDTFFDYIFEKHTVENK